MFEAIHGSAPRRAGQNLANPSGLLLGAVQMLVHIGQGDVAEKVQNAWLRTIEDGIHTYDIYKDGVSKEKVGTREFADAVIARIGLQPSQLKPVSFANAQKVAQIKPRAAAPVKQETIGVDVFLYHPDRDAEKLGKAIEGIEHNGLHLTMVTNRGVKVYPGGLPETFCTDHWRCRFKADGPVSYTDIIGLQQKVNEAGFAIIKTENLCRFDGVDVFSAGQGA